jgi:hypothetical protein
MRYFLLSAVLFLCLQPAVKAQTVLIPAGTLLRCTMDEPNFSPKTVAVGDPTLCHLSQITEFGRAAFPRGSYLIGHLDAAKQPGHFFGKGYMTITFDSIGLPNLNADLDAKIVSARGQKTDLNGRIIGHGHAKRDVAEWMFPPLWPWKVLMLPARGPQPRLKTEQQITLRLMEDVEVPEISEYSSGWHHFGDSPANPGYSPQSYVPYHSAAPSDSEASSQSTIAPDALARVHYIPSYRHDAPENATRASVSVAPVKPGTSPNTLIALRSGGIFPVTDYWVNGHLLFFVRTDGAEGSTALGNVDWQDTVDLNAGNGIRLVLRTHPSQSQNESATGGKDRNSSAGPITAVNLASSRPTF